MPWLHSDWKWNILELYSLPRIFHFQHHKGGYVEDFSEVADVSKSFPRKTTTGPFHEWYFQRNSNWMEISFCSYRSHSCVIAIKICTSHDSCVVMVCAIFYSDTTTYNGVTQKNKIPSNLNYDKRIFREMGSHYPLSYITIDGICCYVQAMQQVSSLVNGLTINTVLHIVAGPRT